MYFFVQSDSDKCEGKLTPVSLYQLAAILLNEQLVDMEALIPHVKLCVRERKRVMF